MNDKAGKFAQKQDLIDVENLLYKYHDQATEPVTFGTSGHRGSALKGSFNKNHIAAIATAIAEHRKTKGITGPMFVGADTHALSKPALQTSLEVLTAQNIEVRTTHEYVPTPALSRAIISHNRNNPGDLADGIIITPSHNPPADGGIKYNEPHGGPADTDTTSWIAERANQLLGSQLKRIKNPNVIEHDFLTPYVSELDQIIDMTALKKLKIGVHPLAGAAYKYWQKIKEYWGLNLTVLGPEDDPTWSFMTLDWDGEIRMDPSSKNSMAVTEQYLADFDLVLANDADADRFGVAIEGEVLIAPNSVLAVAIDHLLKTRANWPESAAVGKTLVSSAMVDRVVSSHGRQLMEVPVGFKWFVAGLSEKTLAFGGEESAGASFLQKDGSTWTTDKDGILLCLLAAEVHATTGMNVAARYRELTEKHGTPFYTRVDAKATPAQKKRLGALSAADVRAQYLAGEKITEVLTNASGNGAAIGGVKVKTENAWFAARPSGTEDVYKIYAESFVSESHLQAVLAEAQKLVSDAFDVN